MARLSESQTHNKIKREKQKQEALKRKLDIQVKKELYGENWKQVEHQKLQDELEAELGSEGTPKIYDIKDMYDFFDTISFYKDPDNETLKMDFEQFDECEKKYKFAIEEIDRKLEELRNEKDDADSKKDDANSEKNNANNIMSEDGENKSDADKPVLPDIVEVTEGKVKGDNDDPVNDSEEDELESGSNKGKKPKKIKYSPQNRAKGKMQQATSTYFNRYVPLYDKYVCSCCGTPKLLKDYYIVYNILCSDRVDTNGNFHLYVCKDCCQKLLAYYYGAVSGKNIELAMQYTCAHIGLYWDVDMFYLAKEVFENNERKGTLLGEYIKYINEKVPGKTFVESPFLSDEQYNSATRVVEARVDDVPYEWSEQEARNKREVIHLIGYDPFEYEQDDDSKKILYADFLAMLDDDIRNDYIKLQASLSIVKSFNKIRKLDEKLYTMEKINAPLTEQKSVSDLKAKELKAITEFANSNGFSERFRSKQAKGENTFTGVCARMDQQRFENSMANRFDIATAACMQQAADASFEAIFKQLSLSESEMFKISADQLKELNKVREELLKTKEELRVTKYRMAQIELERKAELSEVKSDD